MRVTDSEGVLESASKGTELAKRERTKMMSSMMRRPMAAMISMGATKTKGDFLTALLGVGGDAGVGGVGGVGGMGGV